MKITRITRFASLLLFSSLALPTISLAMSANPGGNSELPTHYPLLSRQRLALNADGGAPRGNQPSKPPGGPVPPAPPAENPAPHSGGPHPEGPGAHPRPRLIQLRRATGSGNSSAPSCASRATSRRASSASRATSLLWAWSLCRTFPSRLLFQPSRQRSSATLLRSQLRLR